MAKQKANPDKSLHRTDPQITRLDWDTVDWSSVIDIDAMGFPDILQDPARFEELMNSLWFAYLEKQDATTN